MGVLVSALRTYDCKESEIPLLLSRELLGNCSLLSTKLEYIKPTKFEVKNPVSYVKLQNMVLNINLSNAEITESVQKIVRQQGY